MRRRRMPGCLSKDEEARLAKLGFRVESRGHTGTALILRHPSRYEDEFGDELARANAWFTVVQASPGHRFMYPEIIKDRHGSDCFLQMDRSTKERVFDARRHIHAYDPLRARFYECSCVRRFSDPTNSAQKEVAMLVIFSDGDDVSPFVLLKDHMGDLPALIDRARQTAGSSEQIGNIVARFVAICAPECQVLVYNTNCGDRDFIRGVIENGPPEVVPDFTSPDCEEVCVVNVKDPENWSAQFLTSYGVAAE